MADSFISLQRDRKGRWVFAVSFDWFFEMLYFPGRVLKKSMFWIVSWLLTWNFPSTTVTMSVASVGLVAGLLIAIAGQVFIRPTNLLAVPSFLDQEQYGPKIDSLQIDGSSYKVGESESYLSFYSIPRKSVSHLLTSGRPSEAKAVQIMIGYTHPTRSMLQKVNLGDEISLIGDNNGVYNYTVVTTEVRNIEDLSKMKTDTEQVILIVPQTAIQQQFLVVIAR